MAKRSRILWLVTLLASGCAGTAVRDTAASIADAAGRSNRSDQLFYLDWRGRVLTMAIDGSEERTLVTRDGGGADGIAVHDGYLYWTNMGNAKRQDGFILRATLAGAQVTTIVESGATHTPKQLKIDPVHEKLYWSDREGMRVMRSNLDGSDLETLVTVAEGESARQDAANWCVGIGLDIENGMFYWTQKGPDNGGRGTIKRAGFDMPAGQTSENRSDIEVLFDGLPEPVDLEIDPAGGWVYWTDRGDDTINRAPLNPSGASNALDRSDKEILVTGVSEAIGIALDLDGGRMYFTAMGSREVLAADLDGSRVESLARSRGVLTGITVTRR